MSDANRRRSSSSSSDGPPDTPLCIVCDEAAVGVGPFSRHHLCHQHLRVDEANLTSYKVSVDEKLSVDSQQLTTMREALQQQHEAINRLMQQLHEACDELKRQLDEFVSRVTGELIARQEAVLACLRDLDDISSYKQEVACAEALGDLAEVRELTMSMDMSLGDLEADFSLNERLLGESDDGEVVERLRKLERSVLSCVGGVGACDAEVTARPETTDCSVTVDQSIFDPIVRSHEIEVEDLVSFVEPCSDTSGFFSDTSGWVVPYKASKKGCVALPKTCIYVSYYTGTQHFAVLSVDGSVKLRCRCDINWKMCIRGLHCDRQQLFIAQTDAVTVADLTGRVIRQLRPQSAGFGDFNGITGNAICVFVSSGNKIAGFRKLTGQIETIITLSPLPDADFRKLVIYSDCILVTDLEHNQVHKVRIDSQELVASYPKQRGELTQFVMPYDVTVDRKHRMFVSEVDGHSVRVLSAGDGSLLFTLGVPGEIGSGDDRLNCPSGLVVVTGDTCEQLVISDVGNGRILVFNI